MIRALAFTLCTACWMPGPDPAFHERARSDVDALRDGRFAVLRASIAENKNAPNMSDEEFEKLRVLLGSGALLRWEPMGSSVVNDMSSPGHSQKRIVLQYQAQSDVGFARVDLAYEQLNKYPAHLIGLVIFPLTGDLKALNAWTWHDRPPTHFFVLGLAVFILLFCFYAAVRAVRANIRRRLVWAAFALVTVAPTTINWTTGEVSFELLQVVLAGVKIWHASAYAPWTVSVAFPIGALLTLRRISASGHKAKNESAA